MAARRIDLSPQRLQALDRLLRADGINRGPVDAVTPRPDRSAAVPLSFAQRRLWFVEQLFPGTTAYTIPSALRILGPFDVDLFAGACARVMRRHESLRTYVTLVDGEPRQAIDDAMTWPVDVVDIGPGSPTDREHDVRRRAAELFGRPFDLTTGPLARAAVLRLGPAEHVVLIALHHIVADLWSMGLLLREILTGYGELAADRTDPGPELAVQYPDFALWQHQPAAQAGWEADLAYWSGQLSGAPARVDLPTDRPPRSRPSFRGVAAPVVLPRPAVAALRSFAHDEGTTPFTVIAAAFATLLYRLSGQTDIVLGTPVANRTRPETEDLVGLFVNTVLLRCDLSADPTFRELVQRLHPVWLAALDHQDVPFERLVERLQPARTPGHTPLFQVGLLYQNVPLSTMTAGPVRIEPITFEPDVVKHNLQLQLFEDYDTIHGRLEASRDLFDQSTVRRMASYLPRMMRAALADPDLGVGRLPMLAASEREEMSALFNVAVEALVTEAGGYR